MDDEGRRLYRFVDRGGQVPRWLLQLFHYHGTRRDPNDEPTPRPFGTGPYCVAWHRVKARDRRAIEAQLVRGGAEVYP